MARIDNTIFISYRRTNLSWALAIYQNLTAHGYDVFFDYQSVNSGDLEQIILANVRARVHFLVLLTPSALERLTNPDDWMRKEIETAIEEKRNIIPLFLEGFSFAGSTDKYLRGKLASLKEYNGLQVPSDYFEEAMRRLRERFLNIPVDIAVTPLSDASHKSVVIRKLSTQNLSQVTPPELDAQVWFEKGIKFYNSKSFDEAIRCFSEAIMLKPDFAEAFINRSNVFRDRGEYAKALNDLEIAIRINPDYSDTALYNRAIIWEKTNNFSRAISDYQKSLELRKDFSYTNEKEIRNKIRQLEKKIK